MEDGTSIALFATLCSFIFCGALIATIFYFTKRARDRRLLVWRSLAARLGGRVEAGPDRFQGDKDRLILPIDGHTVALDIYIVGSGKHAVTYQRTAVLAPDGWSRSAQIYKETPLFSALGKAFGGQDIQIGDPDFDRTFIIKGSDPAWLQRALGRGVRVAHLAAPEHRLTLSAHSVPALRSRRRDLTPELTEEELRRRVPVGDGVLCLTRVGVTADEARTLAQFRLTVAYARDLLTPEAP